MPHVKTYEQFLEM